MARMDVPAYPSPRNRVRAASRICPRVSGLPERRPLELFITVESTAGARGPWGSSAVVRAAPQRKVDVMNRSRGALVAVCVGLGTVVSAVSSLMVALPDVARHTGASQTQLSWIVDGYALTFAALLLPGGYLGDRLGRRRVLLGGLGLIVVAAAGGALVTEPGTLIA